MALKNNNQFQRDDGKEYQFLSRIERSESKLAENNQQEGQISDETMTELYPDWSALHEDEKAKARAEMEYIQNFKPEDIELFSKYNENIRFLQFLFRGNRVHFIKDPAVRDLVTKRLLQSFGRNKGFVINQE